MNKRLLLALLSLLLFTVSAIGLRQNLKSVLQRYKKVFIPNDFYANLLNNTEPTNACCAASFVCQIQGKECCFGLQTTLF